MRPHHDSLDAIDMEDPVLADLVEELTARVQRGITTGLQAWIDEHPAHAESLRQLLPALQALAGAGISSHTRSESRGALPMEGPAPRGKLGDYQIFREIGRGGMGIVYEAQQISLDRRVALKVLPFAAALDTKQLQRFKTEAQAAGYLHHSNIVPVFAIGYEQGVHYYAMQYIEGQSLAHVIDEIKLLAGRSSESTCSFAPASDRLRPTGTIAALSTQASSKSPNFFRTVASLCVQAAEALAYAHELGVVHRDIKPANLLVDVRGNLWITDFGLARFAKDVGATATGVVVGTLRYMSPEQAAGKPALIDQRTDIYSLGVTLYELLTLEPVFSGNDRQQVLWQIASEDPCPPRQLNKTIPPELETIVLKALAKSPDERYTSAGDLADDLKRFLTDTPILARRPTLWERGRKWTRRHKGFMRAATLMAVLAVAGLAVSTVLIARERDRANAKAHQARAAVDEMYAQVAQDWLAHQPHLEPIQQQFLLKALRFYEDFASENAQDSSLRLETARAEHRVADIQHKLGHPSEAEQAYTRAIALLETLVAQSPGDGVYRAELARCFNDWGNWLRDHERWNEAEKPYRQGLGLFGELALEEPDQPAHWDGLAGCANNLGIVLAVSNHSQEAEKAHRDAKTIFMRLVAEHPDRSAYRHDLAGSLSNLANLLRDESQREEAEACYLQAFNLWSRLTEEFPERPLYRQALASAMQGYGSLLIAESRLEEASQPCHQSLALRQRLATDFPSVPTYRLAQAASLNQLGIFYAKQNLPVQAEQAYRKAQSLLEQLVADDPETPAYRTELAACQGTLSALEQKAARHPGTEQRRGVSSSPKKGQSK